MPVRTIRFYEAEGIVPPPHRTAAGYRLFTPNDVRRLRLVRRARLLGLPLAEVRALVEQAGASECADFTAQLLDHVVRRRDEIDRQVAELLALRAELDGLEEHLRHAREAALGSRQRVAECGFCPMIDGEDVYHEPD